MARTGVKEESEEMISSSISSLIEKKKNEEKNMTEIKAGICLLETLSEEFIYILNLVI